MANGQVYPYLRHSPPGGETYDQRRLLFRNLGNGKFADVSNESGPGIREERSSRGLATGDLDNDGDVDVVIVNMDGSSVDPPERRRERAELADPQAAGNDEQPARAGIPRRGPLGRAHASGGSDHQREHLLGQRLTGPLRPRRRDAGGCRDPVAERQGPDASTGPGEPGSRGGRRSRNRGRTTPIDPVSGVARPDAKFCIQSGDLDESRPWRPPRLVSVGPDNAVRGGRSLAGRVKRMPSGACALQPAVAAGAFAFDGRATNQAAINQGDPSMAPLITLHADSGRGAGDRRRGDRAVPASAQTLYGSITAPCRTPRPPPFPAPP